jgi:ubiquinone/menaquinone biosynthesis C-methylase UbiE
MRDWRSYEDVADTWQRVNAPRNAIIARDLLGLAGLEPGHRVLDVGTGTGSLAAEAVDLTGGDALVVGVDVAPAMLRVGRASHPGLRLAAAGAVDLPFRDATFDIVAGNFVLQHFPRPQTALFDMLRVLRRGGRLALTTWGSGEDDLEKTWRELVEEIVGPDLTRDAIQRSTPGRGRFGDRAAIEETLLDAGLRHVRTERREYRFAFSIADYVAGRSVLATGRFVREMVGADRFEEFLERARTVYAERFADPLNDFRDAWLAVAVRP